MENITTNTGTDMGGSYEYTTIADGKEIDNCVVCGKPSPYEKNTDINFRYGYVEGGGQACHQPHICNTSNQSDRDLITIPRHLLEKYSNNMELGAAIRTYYWDNYK